jgi:hypothetical protein
VLNGESFFPFFMFFTFFLFKSVDSLFVDSERALLLAGYRTLWVLLGSSDLPFSGWLVTTGIYGCQQSTIFNISSLE